MCKLQNIYINQQSVLNFNCIGRLASLSDLENSICEGSEEITDLLMTSDGMVKWQSAENQRKILIMDEDITQEELDEITGEYILVNKNVPSLYTEFINDLDLGLTQILSINLNEDNTALFATTKMVSDQWNYIYNYFIDNKGELQKIMTMIPTFMLATCKAVV
jgi:hypothetical protein